MDTAPPEQKIKKHFYFWSTQGHHAMAAQHSDIHVHKTKLQCWLFELNFSDSNNGIIT